MPQCLTLRIHVNLLETIETFMGDPLKTKKKYTIPSVKREERMGDLRLMRLIFKVVVSAVNTASWNGPQSRSRVSANRSAGIKYQDVVRMTGEEDVIPLLPSGGTLI